MSEKKPKNFYEQSYYQSVHEFEGKFDPEKLIEKYEEIERDSERVQKLKQRFSSEENFLPSITQSVFFGEDEETKKIKARRELNKEMKRRKKLKKKREYKADMPEITEFKEMFEGFRLRYDRTTPYEMGTRNYMTNNKKSLKKIKKNKGWVNYKKKKTRGKAKKKIPEVIQEDRFEDEEQMMKENNNDPYYEEREDENYDEDYNEGEYMNGDYYQPETQEIDQEGYHNPLEEYIEHPDYPGQN